MSNHPGLLDHTRAGVSRGTQCSGSGVSNDARARQRPWISAVLPGTTVATAAKGSPELERRAPSYHRTPRSCIRFTHSLSVIVDFRGGCSTTTHIANDRTSHLTLPRTLGRGSTLTWRSGRHQSGCGWRQSVATSSEAMTAARRSHEDESNHPSQIGAPGRSAGGADRADPVFQPSNGDAHRFSSAVSSERFSESEASCSLRRLCSAGDVNHSISIAPRNAVGSSPSTGSLISWCELTRPNDSTSTLRACIVPWGTPSSSRYSWAASKDDFDTTT